MKLEEDITAIFIFEEPCGLHNPEVLFLEHVNKNSFC